MKRNQCIVISLHEDLICLFYYTFKISYPVKKAHKTDFVNICFMSQCQNKSGKSLNHRHNL